MDVELQIVLQDQLQDNVDREDVVVQVGAVTEILDLKRDDLPGRGLPISDSVPMGLVNEVGPRGANVRYTAVVCSMVDQETNVIVAGLIGVVVVELVMSVMVVQPENINLPRQEGGFDH